MFIQTNADQTKFNFELSESEVQIKMHAIGSVKVDVNFVKREAGNLQCKCCGNIGSKCDAEFRILKTVNYAPVFVTTGY